jgi:hypothetical protein
VLIVLLQGLLAATALATALVGCCGEPAPISAHLTNSELTPQVSRRYNAIFLLLTLTPSGKACAGRG